MRNFISAKRHVTCETVNKSFWQNRAENWGVGSLFFCLLKRTETFKDKTHTAGDGICRHLFFMFFMDKRDGEYEGGGKMDLEAQKRAPIYEALERFRKKG